MKKKEKQEDQTEAKEEKQKEEEERRKMFSEEEFTSPSEFLDENENRGTIEADSNSNKIEMDLNVERIIPEDNVPTAKQTNLPAQELVVSIPGTEEEEIEDFTLPRLRLLQSISSEVEEGESQAGKIRHSLTGKEWDKIQIIPICLRKSRALFDELNLKGAPICFSPDSKFNREGKLCIQECPYDRAWDWDGSKPPRCPKALNFPCIILEEGKATRDFASATFMKSSAQVGSKLIYFRTVSGLPYWAYVYELTSRAKQFPKGKAYIFEIKQVRRTNKEEAKIAEDIYSSSLKTKRITEEDIRQG